MGAKSKCAPARYLNETSGDLWLGTYEVFAYEMQFKEAEERSENFQK